MLRVAGETTKKGNREKKEKNGHENQNQIEAKCALSRTLALQLFRCSIFVVYLLSFGSRRPRMAREEEENGMTRIYGGT